MSHHKMISNMPQLAIHFCRLAKKNLAAASLKLFLADGTERVPYYVLGLIPCYQTKSSESVCVCTVYVRIVICNM